MLLQWKYGSDNGDDSRRGNDSGKRSICALSGIKGNNASVQCDIRR